MLVLHGIRFAGAAVHVEKQIDAVEPLRIDEHAPRELVVAVLIVPCELVLEPAVGVRLDGRCTERHPTADRAANRAFELRRVEAAIAASCPTVPLGGGLARDEIDCATGCVAPVQRTL